MGHKKFLGDSDRDYVDQTSKNDYDEIYTFAGIDHVSLTLPGTRVVTGNANDKVISHIEGGNRISLGAQDDFYTAKGFDRDGRPDTVHGGGGYDEFDIYTFHSRYYGDSGKDYLNSAGYSNWMDAGSGEDTISYAPQDKDKHVEGLGVKLDLASGMAWTGAGHTERILNFEHAVGTSANDIIRGSDALNFLWGSDGDDIIDGRAGDDYLIGGDGQDELVGGEGADDLSGGAGNDLFIFRAVAEMGKDQTRDVIDDFGSGDRIDLSGIGMTDYIGSAAFSSVAGELRLENNILYGDVDGDGTADVEIEVTNVTSMQDSDFVF